jgi:hypothetical protein
MKTNVTALGQAKSTMETDTVESGVFPEKEKESTQGEEALETYKQAVQYPE